MQLTKITLKGQLAKEFGSVHHFFIESPREAVRALIANFPDFKRRVVELGESGMVYRVSTPVRRQGMDEEEFKGAVKSGEFEIVIRPLIAGSGGFGKILLGIALIAAAFIIPFAAVGGGLKLGLLGAALLLSGISEWLTPKNKKKKDDDRKSSSFNGAAGVADGDYPIPLFYGYMRTVGLPVLSSGVMTADIL